MKIYNKKRFTIGIFFIGVFVLSIFTLFHQYNDIDIVYLIKSVFTSLIALFVGLGTFLTSIDKEANNMADIEAKDERNKLVELNSGNLSSKILTYLFWAFEFLFILLWYMTKVEELLIVVVVFGILITLKLFLDIGTSIYYERKI